MDHHEPDRTDMKTPETSSSPYAVLKKENEIDEVPLEIKESEEVCFFKQT